MTKLQFYTKNMNFLHKFASGMQFERLIIINLQLKKILILLIKIDNLWQQ